MALKTFTTADGSANQALVTNGSGVLSFAAVGAAAGQVIQVITATDQTRRTTTSTTFATGSNTLSVTITPASTANKIFIMSTFSTIGPANNTGFFTIFRGATNLGNGNFGMGLAVDNVYSDQIALSYLDSPSTTSATTYQIYMRTTNNAVDAVLNQDTCRGSITCFEIKG